EQAGQQTAHDPAWATARGGRRGMSGHSAPLPHAAHRQTQRAARRSRLDHRRRAGRDQSAASAVARPEGRYPRLGEPATSGWPDPAGPPCWLRASVRMLIEMRQQRDGGCMRAWAVFRGWTGQTGARRLAVTLATLGLLGIGATLVAPTALADGAGRPSRPP